MTEWESLTAKSSDKGKKLQEANCQRMYTAAVKDLEFWLGEVEHMLETEDYGKNLATVQNLNKKHQLIKADISAHQDHIRDLNNQADAFIKSGVLHTDEICEKKESMIVTGRYAKRHRHGAIS